MAAPTSYPSWVYNSTQISSLIVTSLAAFNALSGAGTWTTTPFVGVPGSVPTDPGFTDTDIRLQQMLIEQRITNQMLAIGFNVVDDPLTQIRPDILANDSSLTS
jgi:hypothetical protein